MLEGPQWHVELESQTLDNLQWGELCERLSERAISAVGKGLCKALKPEGSIEEAQRSISLTWEMAMVGHEEGFPMEAFGDLRPMLDEVDKGSVLSGEALLEISRFLDMLFRVKRFLQLRKEKAPGLWELAASLDELHHLRVLLRNSIDEEGRLREENFPRLRSLRRRTRELRQEIVRRLDAFVKDPSNSVFLQDRIYTIREGRFVVPVKADSRGHLRGVVQGVSSSGSTHYMEPMWLVEMNNSWRVMESEAQGEAERIMQGLSREVSEASETIFRDVGLMAQLDLIYAKARLSMDIQGNRPTITEGEELALPALRHPLLVLRGVPVVSNDIHMGPRERVLLVTGPNAGGKSVLLKAVGLASLMARAGLFPAAGEGASIPFFSKVYADMGDPQDLSRHISTFTGHMRNIKAVLQGAGDDTLVLLDELAGSTDPQEGACLARAVIEELLERGSRVLVTTHYASLKAWAQYHPGIVNGAMEFDEQRLEPTYRLVMGALGRSSGLFVASKTGLPDEVLNRARTCLDQGELGLEKAIEELERQRQALQNETQRARDTRDELERQLSKAKEITRSLREDKEAFVREKRRRLSREVQEARKRVKEAMKALSRVSSLKDVQMARDKIKEVEEGLRMPVVFSEDYEPLDIQSAGPGMHVRIAPLGQEGILLDDPKTSPNRVRVRVGGKEVWVSPNALARAQDKQQGQGASEGVVVRWEGNGTAFARKLDLRGKRVEEALWELERFIQEVLCGKPQGEVVIIHGHGTGALKRAVRKWLSACQWIKGFRPGQDKEGGDGVTVVQVQ